MNIQEQISERKRRYWQDREANKIMNRGERKTTLDKAAPILICANCGQSSVTWVKVPQSKDGYTHVGCPKRD